MQDGCSFYSCHGYEVGLPASWSADILPKLVAQRQGALTNRLIIITQEPAHFNVVLDATPVPAPKPPLDDGTPPASSKRRAREPDVKEEPKPKPAYQKPPEPKAPAVCPSPSARLRPFHLRPLFSHA